MKVNILPTCLLAAGLLLGSYSKSVAQTGAAYNATYSGYSAGIGVTDNYDAGWTHSYVGFNAKRNGGSWILGTDGANNGASLLLGGITGELRFFTFPVANPSSAQTITDAQIAATVPRMAISNTGQVRIGLTIPSASHPDYQLSVDGKLVAKSAYVTSTGWADYVFDKNYRLAPLSEVEAYVKANKHLPEIPTTSEVAEKGIDLAAINTLLLKKVEELTLHLIEVNKRLEAVEAAKR
ncbi:hypothetical protein GCM10027594_12800 [Hymenobacter agri]